MKWLIEPWICTDYIVFYIFMALALVWAVWVTWMMRLLIKLQRGP